LYLIDSEDSSIKFSSIYWTVTYALDLKKMPTMQPEVVDDQECGVGGKELSLLSLREDSTKTQDTNTITIDPRGDLTLKIGLPTELKTFLVCSRTLARTSPVLNRMLYGSFAESKPSNDSPEEWTISLTEINPHPFALLAHISHGSFNHIPKTLTIDKLFDLIVLTHYYDCTPLLAPWAAHWLGAIHEPASDNELEMYRVLFISQELGDKRTFEITSRRLVLETCLTLERDTLHELLSGHLSTLIDRIDAIRESTIKAMLALFLDLTNILVVVDEQPRWCRYASYMGPHRCESMILGSLVFCLTRAGLWPIPEDEEIEQSVMALYRLLTGVVIHDIGQLEKKGNDHAKCNPRGFLMGRLKAVLVDMQDPVGEEERAYVVRQRVRLGLGRVGNVG
jgi:hypothetical protein